VVGAQLAAADPSVKSQDNTPNPVASTLSRDDSLALEALRLAAHWGDTSEQVVDRAAEYLKFLKGTNNG
jgi:hypothetical protein